MELHPFINSFSQAAFALPAMMLPASEKNKNIVDGVSAHSRQIMDVMERLAYEAYRDNQKLIQNEKIVNGEFIPQDYMADCEEEFYEPLNELSKDGGLPKTIKHYDFISAIIKTEIEEFMLLPDTFNIVAGGEVLENEVLEYKKDLLIKYLNEKLELRFRLIAESKGLDLNQQPQTPEEQQALQQQIEALRKEKTPEEIGAYFKYSFRHFAQEWADKELTDQKHKYNLEKLRYKEMFDWLVVGRRFREIKVSKRGLSIEKKNYANCFFHKSPDVEYIQDGNYAGYVEVLSGSDVINKYGTYLTEKQIKGFDSLNTTFSDTTYPNKDFFGNSVNYLSTSGTPYNTVMPTYSPILNQLAPAIGMNFTGPLNGTFGNGFNNTLTEFTAVSAYWRGAKKKGRLCWTNPSTEMYEVVIVDESFIVPKWVKVLSNATFNDEPEENTIVWTCEDEIMQGTKISGRNGNTFEAVYINVKPCEFQSVSEYNLNNKKLPLFGQISNNSNVKANSQVEMVKPFIFLYNVAMNKAYKYMEKSLAAFIAMDIRNIPSDKDYTGKDALFNWIDSTETSGIGLMETSPAMTQGANAGGQFPRVIDVDNTPKVIQHLNIANSIKTLAFSQLGFNPARLGDVSAVDTATGINVGVAKSYNATGSWFTEFSFCEKEMLQYQLDCAQWLQTQKADFRSLVTNGTISDSYLLANNNSFSLYDLKLYISNSQEEMRQLDLFKKLAIENNTLPTNMSTRMRMASTNNAEILVQIVKDEEDKALQIQQQMRELEYQKQTSADELERARLAFEKEKLYAELDNNLKRAWITSRGYLSPGEQDLDSNQTPDAFEYEKFAAQNNINSDKNDILREKINLDREKYQQQASQVNKKLELEDKKLQMERFKVLQTAENVKYLDAGKRK